MSVSLSVEEVKMFLSLIAEERIQREIDGFIESFMYILFAFFIFRVCFLFIFEELFSKTR